MKLLLLDAGDVRAALPMAEAAQLMADGFAALSDGLVQAPQRGVLDVPGGTALVMGAFVPPAAMVSKTVCLHPGNPARGRPQTQALVVVTDPATGAPVALIDGAALTAWRTGAASGCATQRLARRDARIGAVIGCGAQGETQVLAIDAVRSLDEIRLCARRLESAAALAARLAGQTRARLVPVGSAADAVRGAHIVCGATTATEPIVDGALVEPGTHVNGVGSFRLAMREFDRALVARATVFVDCREAALEEAGELVEAAAAGATEAAAWRELGDLVRGRAAGRADADEVTFFKSVGHAVQDAVAAARIVEVARGANLGRTIEW